MKRERHNISYFSLPSDLAGEMCGWPEFVSGQEYSVDLLSSDETVSVRYVETSEERYVSVSGNDKGRLLSAFLGESFTLWELIETL